MNLAEVHDLLTYIAAVDNRRFGDETVVAWQGILADQDAADCREAVRHHFGQSSDYLMPVHIVRGAEEISRERRRRERMEAERLQALTAAPAVPPGERAAETEALLRELRDALPAVDPLKYRRAEVLEWEKAREREARAIEPNPNYNPTAALEGTPTP